MLDEHKVQEQLLLKALVESIEKQEGWQKYEMLSSHIFHGLAYAEYDDGHLSQYSLGGISNVFGGTPCDLAMGTSPNIPEPDREKIRLRREEAIRNKESVFSIEYRLKTTQGTWVWISNKAIRFKDRAGSEGYVYFLVDNTYEHTLNERLRTQQKEVDELRYHVRTDELTGTYSREYFFEKAKEMIDQSDAELYIVRLNISYFKVINELQGMEKGDRLLREIGQELQKQGEKDGFIVGRFSGDKFYLCIGKDAFDRMDFVKRASASWLDMDITLTYGVYPVGCGDMAGVVCRTVLVPKRQCQKQTVYRVIAAGQFAGQAV